MKIIHYLYSLLFTITVALCQEPYHLQTIYGSTTITEPILIELIHSAPMQRLKQVNQYGICYVIEPIEKYKCSRFDHSLGVLFLLRHFNASLDEQVFGLLHDVSHTAFSHVADYIFKTTTDKYSYQDLIFDWYIKETGICDILQKHGFEHIADEQTRTQFVMLKDDLPNLCADRIEYNLYGAYLEGWVTQQEILDIIEHLEYKNKTFAFDSIEHARMFAQCTIELTRQIWCADWNCFLYQEMAYLLRYAFDHQIIDYDDLHFSVDQEVWKKLQNSQDSTIHEKINTIKNFRSSFIAGSSDNYDVTIPAKKFRGVDPLVYYKGSIVQLSQVDAGFKDYFQQTKKSVTQPFFLRYT